MIKKKTVKNIFVILTLCAILIALIVFAPYILQFIWSAVMIFVPFILAYLVSIFANRLADVFQERFRFPRSFAAVLVIILTVGVLGGIVGGIIWKIVDETWEQHDATQVRFDRKSLLLTRAIKSMNTGYIIGYTVDGKRDVSQSFFECYKFPDARDSDVCQAGNIHITNTDIA